MKEKLIRMGKGFLAGAINAMVLLLAFIVISLLAGNANEATDLMEVICISLIATCATTATVLWYAAEYRTWRTICIFAILAHGLLYLTLIFKFLY